MKRAVFFFSIWPFLAIGCGVERGGAYLEQDTQNYPFIDLNDPFAIPDALYTNHASGEDAFILHPASFLSSLPRVPETTCEKEKLRRLVISINMYSHDVMNQSYYMETKTSGAQILEKTFPEIEEFYGEGGAVVNIETLSNYFRGVEFLCDD